jgi:hypothetical protein
MSTFSLLAAELTSSFDFLLLLFVSLSTAVTRDVDDEVPTSTSLLFVFSTITAFDKSWGLTDFTSCSSSLPFFVCAAPLALLLLLLLLLPLLPPLHNKVLLLFTFDNDEDEDGD